MDRKKKHEPYSMKFVRFISFEGIVQMKKMVSVIKGEPESYRLWGAVSRVFELRDDKGAYALDPNEEIDWVSFAKFFSILSSFLSSVSLSTVGKVSMYHTQRHSFG